MTFYSGDIHSDVCNDSDNESSYPTMTAKCYQPLVSGWKRRSSKKAWKPDGVMPSSEEKSVDQYMAAS